MDDIDCELDTLPDAAEIVTDSLGDEPPTAPIMARLSSSNYAPVMPTVSGQYTLYCLVLKWLDNPGEDVNSAKRACEKAAQAWKRLSNGALTFNVVTKVVKTGLTHAKRSLNQAEQMAKKSVDASKLHIYAIFNNNLTSANHGNGDTAQLKASLVRNVLHEMGHCRPTLLGHSGKYGENGVLDPYGDGTSFMSRYPTDKLTAAQLYLLGWLPQDKVALYTPTDITTAFKMQSLYGDDVAGTVKAVLIPRGDDKRPLYLSMPQINGKARFCLHLAQDRGTQRVAVFGNQARYEGLLFQKMDEFKDGYAPISISSI